MTRYYYNPIRSFTPGSRSLNYSDLRGLVERIERLENLQGIGDIKVENSISGFHIYLRAKNLTEVYLVEAAEPICATRTQRFNGYRLEHDKSDGFYSAEGSEPYNDKIWPLVANPDKLFRFRNPLLFTGTTGDYCFIAKLPNLDNDWFLVQIMCPNVVDVGDPDEGCGWNLITEPVAGPGGYSARYTIPIPLIPGMLDAS